MSAHWAVDPRVCPGCGQRPICAGRAFCFECVEAKLAAVMYLPRLAPLQGDGARELDGCFFEGIQWQWGKRRGGG